jgi:hypothetical protein
MIKSEKTMGRRVSTHKESNCYIRNVVYNSEYKMEFWILTLKLVDNIKIILRKYVSVFNSTDFPQSNFLIFFQPNNEISFNSWPIVSIWKIILFHEVILSRFKFSVLKTQKGLSKLLKLCNNRSLCLSLTVKSVIIHSGKFRWSKIVGGLSKQN